MLNPLMFHRCTFEHTPAWIAPAGVSTQKNVHFRVRREFSFDEIHNQPLYIAAESYYALYVNGCFVGNGPARGTYLCNYVDKYDISPFLTPGSNVIAAEVYCNNFNTFIASPTEPAVLIQMGKFATDASWQVQQAADWRSEDLPKYSIQIGTMEWRDLRNEPIHWATGNDNTDWQPATPIPADRPVYTKTLFHRDVPPLAATSVPVAAVPVARAIQPLADLNDSRVAEFMTDQPLYDLDEPIILDNLTRDEPVTIPPQSADRGVLFVADFAQAFIGGIELDIEAPDGAILDVGYEELIEDGRLTPARNHYRLADRYILREGRQTITNPLHYRGGRYIQFVLRNFHQLVRIHRIRVIDRRYPLPRTATFSCSDESLNTLWQRCTATMSACATDTFLDCPWREMSFWVNDFVVQQEFWQQLIGPRQRDLVKRSLALSLSQPSEEGFVPGVCPSDGRDCLVLFPTNLFLAMILRDYQTYTGDAEFVDTILPAVENIFQLCRRYANEAGLLHPPKRYWNFTDWSYWMAWSKDPYPLDEKNTCIVNWFQVLAAEALAEMYRTRDAEKSRNYDTLAQQLVDTIAQTFWDENRELFREFSDAATPASKISHALALLSRHLPASLVAPCQRALQREECLTAELYMMHYVLRTLAAANEPQAAMDLVRQHWGSMLQSDCPTIWEANVYEHGKDAYNLSGSLCHAFALAPVSFLQQTILGVAPLTAGYERFRVSPAGCDLTQAQGDVPTPAGWISVAWKKAGESMELTLSIPAGLTAVLPDGRELLAGKHKVQLIETKKENSTVHQLLI